MFVSGVYVSGDVKGWSVGGEGNHEAVRLRCRTESGVLDYTKIVHIPSRALERDNALRSIYEDT
jgi:hypothetical protein